jgi:hypothetical protein
VQAEHFLALAGSVPAGCPEAADLSAMVAAIRQPAHPLLHTQPRSVAMHCGAVVTFSNIDNEPASA